MFYVCLETNIYIGCALLTEQQHEPKHLQSIKNIIDGHDIKFLIPEIIKCEFERRLGEKKKEITKQLEDLQEVIGKANLKSHHDENQLQSYIKELKHSREKSIEKAQAYIKELFSSRNCIEIPLTPEILVRAYLRQVSNKRPFKKNDYSKNRALPIDTDCVIIESLKEYFVKNNSDEDELLFCTNDSDFYEDNNPHPDIEDAFPVKLKTFKYLPGLLEFLGEQLSEEEKEDFIKIQRRISIPFKQIHQMQETINRAIPWEQIAQIQKLQQEINQMFPKEFYQQIQEVQESIKYAIPWQQLQQMQNIMGQLHIQKMMDHPEETKEDEENEQDKQDNNGNNEED